MRKASLLHAIVLACRRAASRGGDSYCKSAATRGRHLSHWRRRTNLALGKKLCKISDRRLQAPFQLSKIFAFSRNDHYFSSVSCSDALYICLLADEYGVLYITAPAVKKPRYSIRITLVLRSIVPFQLEVRFICTELNVSEHLKLIFHYRTLF